MTQASSLKRYALFGVLALLVAGPSVLALEHHETSTRPVVLPPPQVQLVRPTMTDLHVTSTLSGTLQPYWQAKLYAKVPGYLRQIFVDKGDRVHAGQILAVIEAPELEANAAAAHSRTLQAQADLVERQADYQKAIAEQGIAQLTYRRLHDARKQSPDLIAPEEEDEARAKADEATQAMATAQAQVEAARAEVASMQAAEQQYADLVAYTQITAPFDGIVTARYMDPGAMVQTGVTSASQAMPVVEVMDPRVLRLYVHVAETDVPYVKPGTPITVSIPAIPNSARKLTITRIAVAEDLGTRTMLAEADIPNDDLAWHPGMYAAVTLTLKDDPHALTLPEQAIQRAGDQTQVYVLGPDHRLHVRTVKLGNDDGVQAEVLEGISPTDEVALAGAEPLTDGMEVSNG